MQALRKNHLGAVDLQAAPDQDLVRRIKEGKRAQRELRSGNKPAPPSRRPKLGEAVAAGRAGWKELFKRYAFCVEGLVRRRRLTPEAVTDRASALTAEEFTNTVYEWMWDRCKLSTYEERSAFEHWYNVVLRTIYYDIIRIITRQRALEVQGGHGEEPGEGTTSDPASTEQSASGVSAEGIAEEGDGDSPRTLVKCVEKLPLKSRVVFKCAYLYYNQSFTSQELEFIASKTGRTRPAVVAHARRIYHTIVGPRGQKAEHFRDRRTDLYRLKLADEKGRRDLIAELERIQALATPPEPSVRSLVELIKGIDDKIARQEKAINKVSRDLKKPIRVPSSAIGDLLGMRAGNVDQALKRAWTRLGVCLRGS